MSLQFIEVLIIAGILLVALLTIGIILSRLYRRATKEISFVRTGAGGQKVVMNRGKLVLPVLHDIIPVNMNTLRLEVRRADGQALITHDRMRVDVQAEFYVRVQPIEESIAAAAQTLGQRTMMPEALKELVEGKFVDALRAVAAEMTMEELHEQRVNFVQKVQTAVSEDLLKNGLELETVSLTGLDQTKKEFFNPDNAFDAAGLTRLTLEIEEKRKRRNDIEQDTQVAINTKNLEAESEKLTIQRDLEYAQLQQEREVEIRKASQAAEIKKEQAQKMQEAEQAEIMAAQEVDVSRIQSERQVEEERIRKEQMVKEQDILREKTIESADIDREKTVELANQDRDIAIAEKSKAKSEAEAEADRALAEGVRAQEQVETVRETEAAERQKAVEVVKAREGAEKDAIGITVAAEAQREASEDEAASIRILAEAKAAKDLIEAQGEADAEKAHVAAAEMRYAVEAAGARALNEAENLLSEEIVSMKVKLATIEELQHIIRESVKPMENIDGIKIIQVDGLNGGAVVNGDGSGSGGNGNGAGLADQVVSSALQYRAQAPLIDSILKEVGLSGGDLAGLAGTANTPEFPGETTD